MRAVMVMYDTLCRRFLSSYGGLPWVQTPNFQRLAGHSVQFDNCWVGSMPCMPARRELHTGRYNFLHRSWGPLEPFDDSMPETLARAGVHSWKITDHYHYWEDGGSTYHNRFSAYQFVRGQEGDHCQGYAGPVTPPAKQRNKIRPGRMAYMDKRSQDWVNREQFRRDEDMPQHRTFSQGIDHIRRNAAHDQWFCLIETFDPHEPFFVQEEWKKLYEHDWDPAELFDWPNYDRDNGDTQAREHLRKAYAALLSFCDRQLGRVLDLFDELDLWKDTMLIVNTDHGFLLGEHDWWAKCRMPFWNEIAHIPLWIWDPRSGKRGERRSSLVQTIDLAPTLLDFFNQPQSPFAQGRPLAATIAHDTPVREWGLFGIHGGHVNITDGTHVYMRGPAADSGNQPLTNYTVMPCHMTQRFSPQELAHWDKHPGFGFTKGVPVMAVPGRGKHWYEELESKLYDLRSDYDQLRPLDNAAQEARCIAALVRCMEASEAPPEQYARLGLPTPAALRADPGLARQAVHGPPATALASRTIC